MKPSAPSSAIPSTTPSALAEASPSASIIRALLFGAAIVLYSLAMHYTSAVDPRPDLAAALVIAPFLGGALLLAWRAPSRRGVIGRLVICGGVLMLLAGLWPHFTAHLGGLYYFQHVGIYALLALMFGRTLGKDQTPLVCQFATILQGSLSARHARYARQVTVAWTLYFLSTVAISTLLFFFASFEAWSLFANVLGSPLIGAMFVIEFAVRCRVLPPEERSSIRSSWRAWKLYQARRQASRVAPPPLV